MGVLPELTERQQEVYDFIQQSIARWGYPPTIREIGEHLGIRSTNGVADHLKALKRKGYLTQEGMKSRTLKPTEEAPKGAKPQKRATHATVIDMVGGTGEAIAVPVLGRVAAGEPILAEQDAQGSVVVDSVLLGRHKKVFSLKVVGDSMIEDGIFDGDYIFVQKRSHADAGEIVVVMIDGEATVKRYYPEGDRVRLQPANASMAPIYVRAQDFKDTQIIGGVVGVYRQL